MRRISLFISLFGTVLACFLSVVCLRKRIVRGPAIVMLVSNFFEIALDVELLLLGTSFAPNVLWNKGIPIYAINQGLVLGDAVLYLVAVIWLLRIVIPIVQVKLPPDLPNRETLTGSKNEMV